jgi:F-type H+-transporting ATPase subunit epsilon
MSDSGKLRVEIIAPSGCVFDGYCHMATIPGTNGDLGIMDNHVPTLARLRKGKVSIYNKGNKPVKDFDIEEGFASNVDDKLLILVDK